MSENSSLSGRRNINLAVITHQANVRNSPQLSETPIRCYICYLGNGELIQSPCDCQMYIHINCLINFIMTRLRENNPDPFQCSVCRREYSQEVVERINEAAQRRMQNPRNRIVLERNNHQQISQLREQNELLFQQNERLAAEINIIMKKIKFSNIHLYYLGGKSLLVLSIIATIWVKIYNILDEQGTFEPYLICLSCYYLIVFLEKIYKILVNR